jgi:hypothetical protein
MGFFFFFYCVNARQVSLALIVLLSFTGFLTTNTPVYFSWVKHISFLNFASSAMWVTELKGLVLNTEDGGTVEGDDLLEDPEYKRMWNGCGHPPFPSQAHYCCNPRPKTLVSNRDFDENTSILINFAHFWYQFECIYQNEIIGIPQLSPLHWKDRRHPRSSSPPCMSLSLQCLRCVGRASPGANIGYLIANLVVLHGIALISIMIRKARNAL